MIVLKILRLLLPVFCPLKQRYINWWFGKQSRNAW